MKGPVYRQRKNPPLPTPVKVLVAGLWLAALVATPPPPAMPHAPVTLSRRPALELSLPLAGVAASGFAFMNLAARPIGGVMSDALGSRKRTLYPDGTPDWIAKLDEPWAMEFLPDGRLLVNEVNYTMEFRNSIDTTGVNIPARVIDQRFLGDVAMVEVAVQGLDEPLFARVRETDAPPVGSEIGVRVDTGGVLVFEAGNNNGTNGAT